MPSDTQHNEKYRHNKNILSTFSGSGCNDWKVTIIFYCVVHMIEKFLSNLGPTGIHSDSHKQRRNTINNVSELKRIAKHYQVLYDLSIKSRYTCVTIKDKDVQDAQTILNIIENTLT